jgi:KaiC/GvpD/RAD55 family RecA-like ATPase
LPIYASTKTEKETITALINATEKMKEWNCLTLVIAESEQNHFPASQSKVESYVDSWIAMYYDTKEDEWKRQLRVIKSRAKHDITPLNFYIDKTGIVFE